MIEKFPLIRSFTKVVSATHIDGVSRLVYDTISGQHISVNEETIRLLELCDGSHNVAKIAEIFSKEYPEDSSSATCEKVLDAFSRLKKLKVVKFVESKESSEKRSMIYRVNLSYPLREAFLELPSISTQEGLRRYIGFGTALGDEMTIDEWKRVIDELAELGVLEITLSGGEPLPHQNLFDLISYIRSKPMSVAIVTDGTLVSESVAGKIKKLGVRSVTVRLDGASSQTHDRLRGVKGSFRQAIRAIRVLRKRSLHIRVNCRLTMSNLHELPQMLQLFKKLGINGYKFSMMYSAERESAPRDFVFSPKNHEEFLFIARILRIRASPSDNITQKTEKNCGVGRNHLAITSTGNVLPCSVFDREQFVLGNVRQTSIKEIWEKSAMLNKLRSVNAKEVPRCRKCKHMAVCHGGCRARAYFFLRDIRLHDPFTCEIVNAMELCRSQVTKPKGIKRVSMHK